MGMIKEELVNAQDNISKLFKQEVNENWITQVSQQLNRIKTLLLVNPLENKDDILTCPKCSNYRTRNKKLKHLYHCKPCKILFSYKVIELF